MSRFFRGGRAFVANALHQTRRQHKPTNAFTHVQPAAPFGIAFTPAAAMLNIAPNASSALGAVTTTAVRAASTAAGGSKGCGAPGCCGGMTAVSAGEDGEEPFIGAPSLSPSSTTTVRGVASNDTTSCSTNRNQNTQPPADPAAGTRAADPAAPSPPPRVKCDPYEQGGRPLSTEAVLQHASLTLDPAWRYDTEKRLLVRSFEFGRTFPRGESAQRLFAFVQDLGRIQVYGAHPLYNLNLNLRADSLQVMCKTVPLSGISYQDLMLATKVDGLWFRLMMQKEQQEQKERRKQQQQASGAPQVHQQRAAGAPQQPHEA